GRSGCAGARRVPRRKRHPSRRRVGGLPGLRGKPLRAGGGQNGPERARLGPRYAGRDRACAGGSGPTVPAVTKGVHRSLRGFSVAVAAAALLAGCGGGGNSRKAVALSPATKPSGCRAQAAPPDHGLALKTAQREDAENWLATYHRVGSAALARYRKR